MTWFQIPFNLLIVIVLLSCSLQFLPTNGDVNSSLNFTLGIRTLILSNSFDLDVLPEQIMKAYGANYDLVRVVDKNGGLNSNFSYNLFDLDLNFDTQPRYHSIVLTSAGLEYYDEERNLFPSALSEMQWAELSIYRNRYDIRTVVLSSGPQVDEALEFDALISNEIGTDDLAKVRFVPESSLVESLKSNIKTDVEFYLGNEYDLQPNGVRFFWYPLSIREELNSDNHIIPFLEISRQEATNDGFEPYYLPGAFILNRTNEAEQMHFAFTSNVYTHHGLVLGDIWFVWVTKGIFLGQRRVLLNTHIDDFFLDTGVYNVEEDRQSNDDEDGGIKERTNAIDMQLLSVFQENIRSLQAEKTNFTIELAFNGRGFIYENMADDTSLEYNIYDLRDVFTWVSHTWSHMDLYCVESNCQEPTSNPVIPDCYEYNLTSFCAFEVNEDTGRAEPVYPESGWSPYYLLKYETTRNEWFAKNILYPELTLEEFKNAPTFSPNSIVTPRISGLNYSVAIQAMLESNIFTAVGDNSRQDLAPTSIYHGFNARALIGENGTSYDPSTFTPINGREGLFIIPRFATRVYFDVATPEQNIKEHNSFYGPTCYGFDQAAPIAFDGFKCNTSSFKYERDLTFEEMIQIEGYEVARNLLSYRTDPYMFHQANLKFFPYAGDQSCLLGLWVDALLEWYNKYNTFPIYSYKMDDLETFYRNRMERDSCEVQGFIDMIDGSPRKLKMKSQSGSACHAKITVTPTEGNADFIELENSVTLHGENDNLDNTEVYGTDKTFTFDIDGALSVKGTFGKAGGVMEASNSLSSSISLSMSTIHTTTPTTTTTTASMTIVTEPTTTTASMSIVIEPTTTTTTSISIVTEPTTATTTTTTSISIVTEPTTTTTKLIVTEPTTTTTMLIVTEPTTTTTMLIVTEPTTTTTMLTATEPTKTTSMVIVTEPTTTTTTIMYIETATPSIESISTTFPSLPALEATTTETETTSTKALSSSEIPVVQLDSVNDGDNSSERVYTVTLACLVAFTLISQLCI